MTLVTVEPLTAVELAALDTNGILDHLDRLREAITEVEAARDELYRHRLAAFIEARGRTPAITQRAIAERSGVSEVAVIQALKKHAASAGK